MEETKNKNSLVIAVSVIIAGILIAAAVWYSKSPSSFRQAESPPPASPADYADDGPVLGNPDAKVAIAEFADFQCPFCQRFFQTTEKQILDDYVKTGKAKFVYRNFAFLGQESEWAAEAAECARAQGKFWEYHDYLFNHQQGENEGAFSKDNLKNFAAVLNLDSAKFNSCLDSDKYLSKIRKDTDDGKNFGVQGTPTTFVNGQLISGAVPFEQIQQAVEEELAKIK